MHEPLRFFSLIMHAQLSDPHHAVIPELDAHVLTAAGHAAGAIGPFIAPQTERPGVCKAAAVHDNSKGKGHD